ncbi:D-glucuronyl C5-epimerase family protein [Streptomyces sp. NPDC046887]|uniref:D-glucuronyl C5-epimerase family protein n=1 Tax=Streptomyces sp. NPDC046887 TaxID=3155472 RepID=UPI0033EDC74C
MPGKRRAAVGRRRFIRLAGGTVAGGAVVGGGAFTAMATGVFDDPVTDPYARMPRSLALSLPGGPGADPGVPLPPLPDPLNEGTASIPDTPPRIPYSENMPNSRAGVDVPTTLPFEFKTSGFKIVSDLPESLRPWRNRPTSWANVTPPVTDKYHLNAQGVYMYYKPVGTSTKPGPVGYDHPVGQIQFGLGCISSYRTEKDATKKALFLKRAKDQANRLITKRVVTRGAWYFPYPWDYTHTEHGGVSYKAPWYSGMSQGEAISLFAQLAGLDGITEQERTLYTNAANGAFASLLRGDNGYPWVVNKDKAGYLWIQEYPFKSPGTGDYTYNGMVFAMFGLWDYYLLTGNELAAKLYDGACTTMTRYFSLLRNPRWFSFYCQTHRIPATTYHHHHITLWTQLHWHTNSPVFANQLDALIDDFPSPVLPAGAKIAIGSGTHTLYTIDAAADGSYYHDKKTGKGQDKILSSKKVNFARATQAPVNQRRRIKGAGIWYRISEGAYKGMWIGEAWPNVFLRGEYVVTTYRIPRTLTVAANAAVTAYKFGADGVTGTTMPLGSGSEQSFTFDRRAVVNGRAMCRISAGAMAGHWVPANQVITDGRV